MEKEINSIRGKVILDWKFEPSDFLEVVTTEEGAGYQLVINKGNAVATIDSEIFDTQPQLRNELHTMIYKRLQAAQLIKQRGFKLSDSQKTRVEPDGRKTIYIEPKGALILVTAMSPDILIHDAEGTILVDTKQERLDELKHLSGLLMKHSGNPVLDSLLIGWEASINDPNNALFHLYRIRDTLQTAFGNQTKMKQKVGITDAQNNRFGELCSSLPLREGRHPGKAYSELRSATADELKEARDIAKAMIDGYLRYLSNQTQNQEG